MKIFSAVLHWQTHSIGAAHEKLSFVRLLHHPSAALRRCSVRRHRHRPSVAFGYYSRHRTAFDVCGRTGILTLCGLTGQKTHQRGDIHTPKGERERGIEKMECKKQGKDTKRWCIIICHNGLLNTVIICNWHSVGSYKMRKWTCTKCDRFRILYIAILSSPVLYLVWQC